MSNDSFTDVPAFEAAPSGRKIHANEGTDPDPHAFWITTFSGRHFYPADPEGSVYLVGDIAHALSQTCRFGGQCSRFYSVAEHSVIVSRIAGGISRDLGFWGLLHDAAEAYLCDLPRPIKYLPAMAGYRELENRVEAALLRSFGLEGPKPEEIKLADRLALRLEARDLGLLGDDWDVFDWPDVTSHKAEGWEPRRAEAAFIAEFESLTPLTVAGSP